ncbi:GPALPP motifs-containing protein 1 [Centruroides vittatus]|uniref:GPALPP motifs-containing protein 1 n=1 Tax=Centruroides vittatus TaxID=120091 RepID=UPI00351040C4
MEGNSSFIGPVLPPGFRKEEKEEKELVENDSVDEAEDQNEEDNQIIGPALPSNWKSESFNSNVYGPALPPGFKKEEEDSEDSDDGYIGPLPCEAQNSEDNSDVIKDFERRAKNMKIHLEQKNQNVTTSHREEWMTVLPDNFGVKIGLGPRTFSQRVLSEKEKDRSCWTDTPSDVERKAKEKKPKEPTTDLKEITEHFKNEKIAKELEDFNKSKRPESLLEIHRKNRKRKAEMEKSKPEERRPFDRDVDLTINRINPSQRKKLIDNAKYLDSRFSHGSSHYL